jgi:thymidylate synthase
MTVLHPELQYLEIARDIMDNGHISLNERTGIRTKSLIGRTVVLDVENGPYPTISTRKAPTRSPIAEFLGYMKGLTNAEDFAKLGAPTWYANANETKAWLENPVRKGENDCGQIYGAVARNFPVVGGGKIDLLNKIVNNIKQNLDDRGEIITYWHPGMFHLGALRPCLHTLNFALQGDDLYLEAHQRSADWAIGTVTNLQQTHFALEFMAFLTNKNPKRARLHMTNAHIYENQFELMEEQLSREPILTNNTKLILDPNVKSVADIDALQNVDGFKVTGYDNYHPAIKYPFAS